MLIGICGKKQAGKSTIAKELVDRYGFVEVTFAGKLKKAYLALDPIVAIGVDCNPPHMADVDLTRVSHVVKRIGWDNAKEYYPEIRRGLQRLGTEAGREVFGEDFWVDLVRGQVEGLLAEGKSAVIPDTRFPNEFRMVRGLGGVIWRVERPGLEAGTGETATHASETAWEGEPFDAKLVNDGSVEDLRREAAKKLWRPVVDPRAIPWMQASKR